MVVFLKDLFPLFSDTTSDANEIVTILPTTKTSKPAKYEAPLSTLHTTTVVYHKEPPQESPFVTYESLKKAESAPKNSIPVEKTSKEISENDVKIFDKTLSKEVEMYSGIPNVLIKLNRTSRKELPMVQETNTAATKAATLELVQDAKLNVEDILIDPKMEDLNANFSENNESEIFIITPTKVLPERLQKQDVKDTTTPALGVQNATSTEEPLEPVPQPHPKPNRKRQLTRPQSRSFYPYFFSRVLG